MVVGFGLGIGWRYCIAFKTLACVGRGVGVGPDNGSAPKACVPDCTTPFQAVFGAVKTKKPRRGGGFQLVSFKL